MIWLFADTNQALSGGAGWVGAGLLGLVLGWLLLKHLPDKDKQVKDMIDSKDAAMKAMMDRHDQIMAETRKDFKESLNVVVQHCEKEFANLRNGKI